MAAVWAAGPEPMIMTLECMVREGWRARPRGVGEKGRLAEGEVWGRKDEAAARVRVKVVRRGEVEARWKARENSLVVGGGFG